MTIIHIAAQKSDMAQSVRNALQPLWPDVTWQHDDATTADIVLAIGAPETEFTMPVLRIAQTPIRLGQVVQRLKEMVAYHEHLDLGAYQLDLGQRLWCEPNGETRDLTEKEVALLSYLATMHPTPVSREDLLREVWKYADGADTHTVETHLYRLRQKIEQNPGDPAIVVSTKQGYILGIL